MNLKLTLNVKFEKFMRNLQVTGSKTKVKTTKEEKYPTNPPENDPRYIFDWDDYIEEQKKESLRKDKINFFQFIF